MHIGEKMKAVRKAKGLTLLKVATALGLKSTGHLSQIERGEKEPSETLQNHFKLTFSISENWWARGEGEIFTDKFKQFAAIKEAEGLERKRVAESQTSWGQTRHPDPAIQAVIEMMESMDKDTKDDIRLSVKKEKLLRDLLKQKEDREAG